MRASHQSLLLPIIVAMVFALWSCGDRQQTGQEPGKSGAGQSSPTKDNATMPLPGERQDAAGQNQTEPSPKQEPAEAVPAQEEPQDKAVGEGQKETGQQAGSEQSGEAQPAPKPEAQVEPQPAPKPEAQVKPQPAPKPEAQVKPQPAPKPQPKAAAQAMPPDPMLLKAPEGVAMKQAPVSFSHKSHSALECAACHHTWDGKGAIGGCMEKGCHDLAEAVTPQEKKSPAFFYNAFHARGSQISCVGCHGELKKAGQPTGPTGCQECHPKQG
jgi:hypothetical protein